MHDAIIFTCVPDKVHFDDFSWPVFLRGRFFLLNTDQQLNQILEYLLQLVRQEKKTWELSLEVFGFPSQAFMSSQNERNDKRLHTVVWLSWWFQCQWQLINQSMTSQLAEKSAKYALGSYLLCTRPLCFTEKVNRLLAVYHKIITVALSFSLPLLMW